MDSIKTQEADIFPCQDRLDNGLTVVTVEMPHWHSVELGVFVRAGLRMESPGTNGISHFLEHMLFRGNRAFPDSLSLNREFESIGRDLRASTHSEYTFYGFSPYAPNLDRAVELLGLFFDQPTFPSLEVEREIILEECQEDLNEKGEMININNLACRLLYPGHPLSWPVIGTEATIRALKVSDLRRYFETFYHPANMVLVGAGALHHARFLELARRCFTFDRPAGRTVTSEWFHVEERQTGPQTLFQEDPDNQLQIQVCFRGISYRHPDFFALLLINRMFDDGVCSRLQRVLREERGLVYSVENRATSWTDTGTFDFDVQVRPEKTEAVLDILFAEIKRFLTEGPDQAELDHVRRRYLMDLELELDDPIKQIDRYGFSNLYSRPLSIDQERERVEAVRLEDIRRVASRILCREGLNVVLVGRVSETLKRQVERLADAF